MDALIETVTAAGGGQRLDAFWQTVLDEDGASRARIQDWIRRGRATIDGQRCAKPATRLRPGQTVTLEPDYPPADITPVDGPLQVLHADTYLAVIDKAPGLTVHPAPSVPETTLVHFAAARFPALLALGGERPGIVHRLDKDTSGLIVLALTEPTRMALSAAFAEREVYKEYLALVRGVPREAGRITLSLDRHPTIKTRMAVADRGGRPAESRFRRVWIAPDRSASLLRVHILTGRTHQIRVHLAAIGHPILGDTVYADAATAKRAPRQMLHAWQVRLRHPADGRELAFSTPPPPDFQAVLRGLCAAPLCVGLTGVTGCGKSAVRRLLEELGVPVFCADEAVARSYAAGGKGAAAIRHYLGPAYLAQDGSVDKAALLEGISEPGLRREVERIVHPLVRDALTLFRAAPGPDLRVAEIPLLCEAGLQADTDLTAVVYCPEDVRRDRLHQRGWSTERIIRTDGWQWPQAAKVAAAGVLVDNSGSLDDLQRRTEALLRTLHRLAARRVERHLDALHTLFLNPDFPDETDLPDAAPAR